MSSMDKLPQSVVDNTFPQGAYSNNGINLLTSSSEIVVPISTRVIGFHTQILFSRAFLMVGVETQCSIFSLFRISLFQLHYRMTRVRESKLIFYDEHFCTQPLRQGFYSIISNNIRNFSSLAQVINALGNFTFDGVGYTPRFPVLPKSNFPDPINVHATNLREIVEALSDPKTDIRARKYFYDLNPLPCAKWCCTADPNFPILLNPDDFMKVNYDEDDLLKDVAMVNSLFCHLPQFLSVIRYDASGDPAILVSNRPNNLKIAEIPWDSGVPAYEKSSLQGNISKFWSPKCLSMDQLYKGSMYLVGELPNPNSFDMNFALRAPTIQVLQGTLNWRALSTKLGTGDSL